MGSPLLKLVAQRIALGVLLLFAVSILIFAGTQILPGDVAQSILGQSATPESLANLRAELDEAKRKQMYHDMAVMVRDEGGLILPMFNQFIDATGAKVGGWVDDPHQELMNGYALAKCWLQA